VVFGNWGGGTLCWICWRAFAKRASIALRKVRFAKAQQEDIS